MVIPAELNKYNEIDLTEANLYAVQGFGIMENEVKDLRNFIVNFMKVSTDYINNQNDKSITDLINVGNKTQAYTGYMLFNAIYTINPEILITLSIMLNTEHDKIIAKDPESTKASDIYELLSCMFLYFPARLGRKLILTNHDFVQKIIQKMKKRPVTISTILARESEIFFAKKMEDKIYSQVIISTLEDIVNFLRTKNNLTPEITDAVNVNFKQLTGIIKKYIDMGSKKESLKKTSNLVNKKADIGQVFFSWIINNPSCAMKVIELPEFSQTLLTELVNQLRIQHVAELAILLNNLAPEKYEIITKYLVQNYNLHTYDDYVQKISDLISKENDHKYGLLLRYIFFMPVIYVNEKMNYLQCLEDLQAKLSSVANNLTASLSNKSFSITIVPMSRSRTFSDISDAIMKAKGLLKTGGFAAKLADKDVVKKIKEGEASLIAIDQISGANTIYILKTLITICKTYNSENPLLYIEEEELMTSCYKIYISQYGYIITKNYFKKVLSIFLSKIEDTQNDYEDSEDKSTGFEEDALEDETQIPNQ